MVEIQKLVADMAAFADSDTVIFDAGDAAGSKPFYFADIGHFNSSLDAMLKNFESYWPGRHGSYIKYCKYIDFLSHFSEYDPFRYCIPASLYYQNRRSFSMGRLSLSIRNQSKGH